MGEKAYSPQACVIWHQRLIKYYWVWLCSLFITMVIWFYHSLAVLILLNWAYIVSYPVTKSIYWKDYYLLLGEAKQSWFIFHYSGDSFLVNLFLISPIMWSISKIQSDLPSCIPSSSEECPLCVLHHPDSRRGRCPHPVSQWGGRRTEW